MNCLLCQKELDAYLMGELPEGIRNQVEEHIESCIGCAEGYRIFRLAAGVIGDEKEIISNPFLVNRIMAGIEAPDQKHDISRTVPAYQNFLRSALLTSSVAAAIFIGILIGNIYKPVPSGNILPVELVYLDDAALEPVNLFSYE